MRHVFRFSLFSSFALASALPGAFVACTSDAGAPAVTPAPSSTTTGVPTAPPVTTTPPAKNCSAVSATRCARGRVQTCVADTNGNLDWDAKAMCSNPNQVCRIDSCSDANADNLAQVADMDKVVRFALDHHGWMLSVDETKIKEDTRLRLLLGDGSGESFVAIAKKAFYGVPAGHSGSFSYDEKTNKSACFANTPNAKIAQRGISWFGVCTAVSGSNAVVTIRRPIANIDLMPGDLIIGAKDPTKQTEYSGPSMLTALDEVPMCGDIVPFDGARRDVTAASLMNLVRPGWMLRVKSIAGVERDVTVPAQAADYITCGDSFNRRPSTERISVTQRADGYLVAWLKTFLPTAQHPYPPQLTDAAYGKWIVEYIADLNAEIAKFPTAKGIIWDVRGNDGGSADLAISIAMGSQAPLNAGGLYKCLARLPNTHPAQFEPNSTPVTAGSNKVFPIPELDLTVARFSYPGKQIVISSGFIYSSSDVFVYAAKTAGLKIVGRRGAGAFGASVGGPVKVITDFSVKDIPFYGKAAGWGCIDKANNPIEGQPPVVDYPMDLMPADLAAGKDSMVEEAVRVLNL